MFSGTLLQFLCVPSLCCVENAQTGVSMKSERAINIGDASANDTAVTLPSQLYFFDLHFSTISHLFAAPSPLLLLSLISH